MGIDINSLGPSARRQVLEKLGENVQPHGKSKYNSQKTRRGNIIFDSKHEAERYDALMILLKAGKIKDLRLQHTFTLSEAYTTPEGKRIRSIKYIADFTYYKDGAFCVEDAKSKPTRTGIYRMKIKMLYDKYGIEVKEV